MNKLSRTELIFLKFFAISYCELIIKYEKFYIFKILFQFKKLKTQTNLEKLLKQLIA